jgi:hypothetical protein
MMRAPFESIQHSGIVGDSKLRYVDDQRRHDPIGGRHGATDNSPVQEIAIIIVDRQQRNGRRGRKRSVVRKQLRSGWPAISRVAPTGGDHCGERGDSARTAELAGGVQQGGGASGCRRHDGGEGGGLRGGEQMSMIAMNMARTKTARTVILGFRREGSCRPAWLRSWLR